MKTLIDDAAEALVIPSFTRLGFQLRRRLYRWAPLDSYNLEGRVLLVTGGTSGLGEVAAEHLARLGGRVRLLARNAEKAEAVGRRIAASTGNDDVRAYVADMSDLSAVRKVAGEIREEEERLDVVIHNAGALLAERRLSPQGFEMTFATMVLGPFLLTNALVPMLERSEDARIIVVTSGGMYTQRLHLDDLQMEQEPYRGTVAYARAKKAQVVLTRLWAQRLRGTSIVAHAMHPGWADTPGIAASLPGFYRLMQPLLRTPAEGADTMVWLAAAPEVARATGRLWLDRRPRSPNKLPWTSVSDLQARELWDACVRMTGSDLASA